MLSLILFIYFRAFGLTPPYYTNLPIEPVYEESLPADINTNIQVLKHNQAMF